MPALIEDQLRTKTLLWSTYQDLGLEEVKWCWSWMLGECGKWEEKTMWQVLNRWVRNDPKHLPTLTNLIAEAFKRNREITDTKSHVPGKTPAEPVQRTNPHAEKVK